MTEHMINESSGSFIIDSHHHFWDLGKFKYDWMPNEPNILLRNYLPDDLVPILKHNGVSGTILIQAHQSIEEAEFLLDLAKNNCYIHGVVIWIDLTSINVSKTLDRLIKFPKLVGVRHQVENEPDVTWLNRYDVLRGLKEVAHRGLAYDLLIRPIHLKHIPELAEKIPELRMVVDHIAKPDIRTGSIESWAKDIAFLSTVPNIYCKVSGMVTEAAPGKYSVDDFKPYVSHVKDSFGIDRLMWGSDWPVCLLAANYSMVLSVALDTLGYLTYEDEVKFFSENATRFYGL